MKNNNLLTVKDYFKIIFSNTNFIRFLKEHHAYKAYCRLIHLPEFMEYHKQTILYFPHEIKTGCYLIDRAFPWENEKVKNCGIDWFQLYNIWSDLLHTHKM